MELFLSLYFSLVFRISLFSPTSCQDSLPNNDVLPKMHSVVRELDCGLHSALIEALHFTFLLSGNKTNISLVLTKHFHLHEPLGEICPFYRCGTRSSERLSELSKAT